MRSFIVSILAVVLLASCAQQPKQFVVLLPDEDGKVGAVEVKSDRGSKVISDAGAVADIGNPAANVARLSDEEIARTFGSTRAALPPEPVSFILYFKSDSDELTADSQAELATVLTTIEGRPAPQVAVIGHTDRVGEAVYNARLAATRADVVRDILVGRGLSSDLIAVSSHGEYNPLIATRDGVAEPRNRRVEITVR